MFWKDLPHWFKSGFMGVIIVNLLLLLPVISCEMTGGGEFFGCSLFYFLPLFWISEILPIGGLFPFFWKGIFFNIILGFLAGLIFNFVYGKMRDKKLP